MIETAQEPFTCKNPESDHQGMQTLPVVIQDQCSGTCQVPPGSTVKGHFSGSDRHQNRLRRAVGHLRHGFALVGLPGRLAYFLLVFTLARIPKTPFCKDAWGIPAKTRSELPEILPWGASLLELRTLLKGVSNLPLRSSEDQHIRGVQARPSGTIIETALYHGCLTMRAISSHLRGL